MMNQLTNGQRYYPVANHLSYVKRR